MKIADAAKIQQVSERTIRRWIRDGLLRTRSIHGIQHVDGRQVELVAEQWRGKTRARIKRHDLTNGRSGQIR